MICPFCKSVIPDEAIKCRYCASFLNLNTGGNTDAITADEISAFVGDNAYYYRENFLKFNKTGIEHFSMTWNWSCFGFTFFWMLYRKMYVESLLTFVVFCIPGVNVILHIVAGIVGNYLFYRHAKVKILEIRATQSPQNYLAVLQEAGGVHKWVIWVGVVVTIIMAIIFSLFFAAFTTSLFTKIGDVVI